MMLDAYNRPNAATEESCCGCPVLGRSGRLLSTTKTAGLDASPVIVEADSIPK